LMSSARQQLQNDLMMMMMMIIIIIIIIIIIVKIHPWKGHEGTERKYMYGSTLSLTSALDGVDGQCHAPAALPPGKTRHPPSRRLGGPQGRSGRLRKIWSLKRFDPRTVQLVTSSYTDWESLAPIIIIIIIIIIIKIKLI
jgi:hypothetical protein